MSSKTRQPNDLLAFERRLWAFGTTRVAGVDEAGRGPLAGPVVAAAVIFEPGHTIDGVRDSKRVPPSERETLYERIVVEAVGFGIGIVDHDVIDSINILQATYRAMHLAIEHLPIQPEHVLIDGNRFDQLSVPYSTIVDGDVLCFSIAAASIVAKVTRDRLMIEYDKQYPGYGFAHHKGYGTPEHRAAIRRLGLCEIHRRSFARHLTSHPAIAE
ncbi:MAG: ribonuclease HII [Ignavibacteria bacterium]